MNSTHADAIMSGESSALDGNAAAGLLQQIFAVDTTRARIQCSACESVQPLAKLMLYGLPMGNILRCPQCQAALIRAVTHGKVCWLDFRGVSTIHLLLD